MQDVQKLPWERQQTLETTADTLRQMACGLPKPAPAPGAAQRRVQQQLDTAGIRRELEESTDQEFDELWPSLSKIIESQAAPPKEVRV